MMNKQKKRAISRGKFERVMEMVVVPHCWDNSFWANEEMALSNAGFFYWADHNYDTGTVKYFRKSITEAFK